jgi:hypothetical protein
MFFISSVPTNDLITSFNLLIYLFFIICDYQGASSSLGFSSFFFSTGAAFSIILSLIIVLVPPVDCFCSLLLDKLIITGAAAG